MSQHRQSPCMLEGTGSVPLQPPCHAQNWQRTSSCSFKAPSLWAFVRAALRNQPSNLTRVPACLSLQLSFCGMDTLRASGLGLE